MSARRPWPLCVLLAPLCLLCLACPGDTPKPPITQVDDEDAVHATRVIHRRLESGDVDTVDSTGVSSSLSVLVPTGDTFETRPFVSTGESSFRFDDVPQGLYYLKRGTGTYVITSHRELDLGEYVLGREGVVTVSAAIPVTLTLDGLAPMDAYQEFDVASPNAGAAGVLHLDPAPQPGATSLTEQPAEYRSAIGRQEVLDGTKGDRLYLLQKLRRSAGAFNYFAVAQALTLSGVSLRGDGQATLLRGSFGVAPQRQLTLDWRRSSFEAFRAAVHPLAVALPEASVRHSLVLVPAMGGLSKGVVGYVGDLLVGNLPAASQDVNLVLDYGNPYPLTWGVVASVVHRYQVPVRLPAQARAGSVGVSLMEQGELSAFSSGPVQIRLSPPTQLRVDGRDAQQDGELDSLTPVFTWEPPELGTADVYELRILRLSLSPTVPDTIRTETVATFLTAERQVRLPPGVLEAKQSYVVRVAAMRTPGVDLTQAPYQADTLVDTSLAETLSSVLSTH